MSLEQIRHPTSKLTARYQTTVPLVVRELLGLQKNDTIEYIIQPDGQILISRAVENESEESDPALESFLSFLERDIKDRPEHIQPITSKLVDRARALVADLDVNLDESLSEEDE
ncbi:MAG: type II toxin-antitoxin system PrlF family antitoxin [Cyanobacteria bacterium J007]|nr:MAG: type II toxin-antitoxin system PrlF family antitoxin [Cyanobacteria bacterium J007]